MLDSPVYRDDAGLLGPRDQPRRQVAPPIVGTLDLEAIPNPLAKKPEFIVDAVGVARHIQRRQRVQKARRQPAEAAVAERRVGLFVEQQLQIDSVGCEEFAAGVDDAEIEQIVFERTTDEVFQR